MFHAPFWRYSERLRHSIWTGPNLDLLDETSRHNAECPGARVEIVDDGNRFRVIIIVGDPPHTQDLKKANRLAQDWHHRLQESQASTIARDEFLAELQARKGRGETYGQIADSINHEVRRLIGQWVASKVVAAKLKIESGEGILPSEFLSSPEGDHRLLLRAQILLEWLSPSTSPPQIDHVKFRELFGDRAIPPEWLKVGPDMEAINDYVTESIRLAIGDKVGFPNGHGMIDKQVITDRLKGWRKANKMKLGS